MGEQIVPFGKHGKPRSKKTGFLHFCPTYLYLLLFFIIVKLYAGDVWMPLVTFGNYSISWVVIFIVIAALLGIGELLKVTEPHVDNVYEALAILGGAVVFLLLFAFGATGAKIWFVTFEIFNNTEFLILMLLSGIQAGAAFIFNSRTLQVQIV